jgi:hypothetical protein
LYVVTVLLCRVGLLGSDWFQSMIREDANHIEKRVFAKKPVSRPDKGCLMGKKGKFDFVVRYVIFGESQKLKIP